MTLLRVNLLDGAAGHLQKAESFRQARIFVKHDFCTHDTAKVGKVLAQLTVARGPVEIADEHFEYLSRGHNIANRRTFIIVLGHRVAL